MSRKRIVLLIPPVAIARSVVGRAKLLLSRRRGFRLGGSPALPFSISRLGLSFLTYALVIAVLGCVAMSFAQRHWRMHHGRGGVPDWKVDEEFRDDVFTFVRVRYQSSGYGSGGGWRTDYPDSDLNFSYRLQQLTSLKVDPNGKILELTDPELFDYPFLYLIEPGRLFFREAEVESLRRYLQTGGFLMVDDFWGEAEWDNFYREIKRVFPDREPIELPLSHPVFHCVYDLKEKPQIPSINVAWYGRGQGITWERPDARTPHYRAILDDQERIMVIICHNTDLGDGWEREGEDEWYFREFSEKKAYPLGINIVTYAMTH